MLVNVEKMISDHISKMKPEQIGNVLISALQSFDMLPGKQQQEIKSMLRKIMA